MTARLIALVAAVAAALVLAACGDDEDTAATPSADAPAAVAPSPDAPAAAASSFETVTPAEIAPRVESREVLLVDVREDAEWEAGRAEEAIHVPLATVGSELSRIAEEADGRPIAFICRSGNRSSQASQIAVDGGIGPVINVDGGMGAWVDAGLPIVPQDGQII